MWEAGASTDLPSCFRDRGASCYITPQPSRQSDGDNLRDRSHAPSQPPQLWTPAQETLTIPPSFQTCFVHCLGTNQMEAFFNFYFRWMSSDPQPSSPRKWSEVVLHKVTECCLSKTLFWQFKRRNSSLKIIIAALLTLLAYLLPRCSKKNDTIFNCSLCACVCVSGLPVLVSPQRSMKWHSSDDKSSIKVFFYFFHCLLEVEVMSAAQIPCWPFVIHARTSHQSLKK